MGVKHCRHSAVLDDCLRTLVMLLVLLGWVSWTDICALLCRHLIYLKLFDFVGVWDNVLISCSRVEVWACLTLMKGNFPWCKTIRRLGAYRRCTILGLELVLAVVGLIRYELVSISLVVVCGVLLGRLIRMVVVLSKWEIILALLRGALRVMMMW